MLNKDKKGQISLSDAPKVVLIVGLVFLLMATIAFIGAEFQDSLATNTATVTGETGAYINSTGYTLENTDACNFENPAITSAINYTDGTTIASGNYILSSAGVLTNATTTNYANVSLNYTYDYGGTACNVTEDLNTEISNNTSIAGIVLTISLVGIVLSVLIGIFVLTRARRL